MQLTLLGTAVRALTGFFGAKRAHKLADQRVHFPFLLEQTTIIRDNVPAFTVPKFRHRMDSIGNDLEWKLLFDKVNRISLAQSKISQIASTELRKATNELHESCMTVLNAHGDGRDDEAWKLTQDVIYRARDFDEAVRRQLRVRP